MVLKAIVRRVFSALSRVQKWAADDTTTEALQKLQDNKLTDISEKKESREKKGTQIINLWDYLSFKENTQAHHIVNVLNFEEWTPMEEILRRVNELFNIEYKNERSLYPYLKTLVDSGLLEATMHGGKMRWRKKNLLKAIMEEEEEQERLQTLQPTQ